MNRKSLPPVSSSNSINLTPNVHINHRSKIKIYQRNFYTLNSSNNSIKVNSSRNLENNIRKKIFDIGMSEIEKNIKTKTKDDLITKLIFGKKIKNINDSDYFLVSPEMEKSNEVKNIDKLFKIKSPKILKKSINYFQIGTSGKKNSLLKELTLYQYPYTVTPPIGATDIRIREQLFKAANKKLRKIFEDCFISGDSLYPAAVPFSRL